MNIHKMRLTNCFTVNGIGNIWENQNIYLKKSSSLQSARSMTLSGTLDFECGRANSFLMLLLEEDECMDE